MRQYFRCFIILICCCTLIAASLPGHSTSSGRTSLITIGILFLLLIIFLLLTAFYAGSETALVSVDRLEIDRLVAGGNKNALIVQDLVKVPERMLGLTLVGTNLMHVATSELGLFFVIALIGLSKTAETFVKTNQWIDPTMVATITTTVLILNFWRDPAQNNFSHQSR